LRHQEICTSQGREEITPHQCHRALRQAGAQSHIEVARTYVMQVLPTAACRAIISIRAADPRCWRLNLSFRWLAESQRATPIQFLGKLSF
jgi:hypothetical protein